MKINLEKFRERDKYINCQKHNTLDLLIWNYNHFCQFDKVWDEYTEMARGLITDLEGNIVARSFKKFFNLNEREETRMENLPLDEPKIVEKYDGSLGIQYYDGDKVCISTRGSFNSEQAIWATEWMKHFAKENFKEGYTYLYEIIYPENRIVIDYGNRKELVLLAVKNIETGEEIDFVSEAKRLGLRYPKIIDCSNENIIMKRSKLSGNEEGFVLNFKNLKVKMKGDEYVRLHRLITGFSTKSIWECLKNNQDLENILKDIPDEFYNWVKEKEKELKNEFNSIKKSALESYEEIKDLPTRKEQALKVLRDYKKISAEIFALLDGKDYEQVIWKKIKPEYELPFKKDINNS